MFYFLYVCLPRPKNDGRGELCFGVVLNDFLLKKEIISIVSCPRLPGKVAASADERGRLEQIRKNKK